MTTAATPGARVAAAPGGSVAPGWEAAADLVVVGGGVAGLAAAIEATRSGLSVLVLSKDAAGTATQYAQGGMAVAIGEDIEAHVRDTIVAGAGLCDEAAVRSIVGAGADAAECAHRHRCSVRQRRGRLHGPHP
ncbi:aspartate oxidase [Rhodococcus sp. SORGH_AS303]|nr:aspartate oxidase [Rhodococcus sp. SORGH_AS_0303]